MKKFVTDEEFWKIFPEASIAVLSVKEVQEAAVLDAVRSKEIESILKEANEGAKRFVPNEPISENEVVKAWREAYSKFPTKKGARCSLESLKYAFPIGAENLDAIEGDLHLGVMKGGEEFFPIGSDKMEPPLPGEIAYYDQAGVICRCWNWRDGKRTEVTDETTREFIAMECIEKDRVNELQAAVDELAELLSRYVGAKVMQKQIIDINHREADLEE